MEDNLSSRSLFVTGELMILLNIVSLMGKVLVFIAETAGSVQSKPFVIIKLVSVFAGLLCVLYMPLWLYQARFH